MVGAWPFRHPKPPPEAVATPGGPADLPARPLAVRLEASPLADVSPAVGMEQVSLKSRKTKKLTVDEMPTVSVLESLGGPPPLGQLYQSLVKAPPDFDNRQSDSPYVMSERGELYAAPSPVRGLASEAFKFQPAVETRPKLRDHRIVDGDTLDGLAERYLGKASRAEEIFELNRDLLRDPNILPVGKRLRIPDRGDPALTPVARVE
jgi:nucleoid-associated protein YgaU